MSLAAIIYDLINLRMTGSKPVALPLGYTPYYIIYTF